LGSFRAAQLPQNRIKKNYFLVVLDYFLYKNGPDDSVRGLFSSLEIKTYSRLHAGLQVPFWVHLGSPNALKQHKKDYFVVVLDYLSYKNGPDDLVRGLF
jgi:hypothetical protein